MKACAFKFKLMLLTLIVFVTTRNGLMNLSDYAVIFREQAQRITPFLCVNPDQKKFVNDVVNSNDGAVAELYEQMAGPVACIGKPYPLIIYECAIQRFPNIPKDRILCIGDSPNHDIKGGRLSGMDTALVRAGIFAD